MAINYTNLFTVLGKYVKTLNTLHALHSTIETGYDDIEGQLETQALNRLIGNVRTVMDRAHSDLEQWPPQLIALARQVLTDAEFVTDELTLQNPNDINELFVKLFEDMESNSETINTSAFPPTDTRSTYFGNPTGSADGNTTKKSIFIFLETDFALLDGVSSPIPGANPNPHYIGHDSLLGTASTTNEKMLVECTNGEENTSDPTFVVTSKGDTYGPYAREVENPGNSQILRYAQFSNLLPNEPSTFENFVNDVPVGWTVTGGTAGTDYGEYNVAFRGKKSFVAKDQGTSKVISLSIPVNGLQPGVAYIASIRGGLSAVLATDNTNTGTSAPITGTITGSTITGSSWSADDSAMGIGGVFTSLENSEGWSAWPPCFVFVPPLNANLTDGLTTLTFTVQPDANDWCLLDEAIVSPIDWVNGCATKIMRGTESEKAQTGDYQVFETFYLIDGNEGVFSRFFRKAFRIQLPATSSSPTIADSLAT